MACGRSAPACTCTNVPTPLYVSLHAHGSRVAEEGADKQTSRQADKQTSSGQRAAGSGSEHRRGCQPDHICHVGLDFLDVVPAHRQFDELLADELSTSAVAISRAAQEVQQAAQHISAADSHVDGCVSGLQVRGLTVAESCQGLVACHWHEAPAAAPAAACCSQLCARQATVAIAKRLPTLSTLPMWEMAPAAAES